MKANKTDKEMSPFRPAEISEHGDINQIGKEKLEEEPEENNKRIDGLEEGH